MSLRFDELLIKITGLFSGLNLSTDVYKSTSSFSQSVEPTKCVNAALWFPEKFNLKCTEKKTECDVGRLSPQIFSVIARSKCQYRPNNLLKGQFPVFPVTSS